MRGPLTKENKRMVILGTFHIFVGLTLLIVWYGLDLDLVGKITALTMILPVWTVALAGLIEGSYWIGGLFPGQTYIGLYLLGHECRADKSSLLILYIWFGVLIGLLVSYRIARFFSKEASIVSNEEHPWAPSKLLGRALLAAYPAVAATHLFERGFQGNLLCLLSSR